MEWRNIPADDPHRDVERLQAYIAEHIEPAMRRVDPACGFSYRVWLDMPRLDLRADHDLTNVVKQITGSNSTGKVSYGTEAGFYQEFGIPTIVCGPGDIAQAHQPDEFVARAQLDECDIFIRRLAARLLA